MSAQEDTPTHFAPAFGDDAESRQGSALRGAVEVPVFVHDDLGLHARPAARVTQAAQQFECEVTLIFGPMRVDAKSILDVLSLAAPRGANLTVLCDGPDAEEAARALSDLFARSILGGGA